MKSGRLPEVAAGRVGVSAGLRGQVDPAAARVRVDLSVIVSKRNEDSSVILLTPKEREWNL